jgi:hypothetical protein
MREDYMKLRRLASQVGAVGVLVPVMPFYLIGIGARAFADYLDDAQWGWAGKLVDISEHIEQWGRQNAQAVEYSDPYGCLDVDR